MFEYHSWFAQYKVRQEIELSLESVCVHTHYLVAQMEMGHKLRGRVLLFVQVCFCLELIYT